VRRGRERTAGRPKLAGFVAFFALAGVVAVLIAGTAITVAGRKAGEREAIVDLRAKSRSLALLRIQPVATDALLTGNITAVHFVDSEVRHYVLDQSVARVKIWNRDGTIVYSDDARLIGANRALTADQLDAIRSNRVRSKISDPSDPANRYERADGKLLQVDLRITTPNQQPLLVEISYRYGAVTDAGDHVWNRFAPFTLGALLALTLVLILVAWLLAGRMRRRLIRPKTEPAPEPEKLEEQRIEPDPGTDLVDALSRLVARTNGGGIATTLDTGDIHGALPPAIAMLLYRATQDALRSLPAHKHTKPVTVRVSDRDHVATLDIVDDGRGKRRTAAHNGANGHSGWRALTDLVAGNGGRLLVEAAEKGGTHVHLEVPLP
jgi:hypothetical protein